MLEKLPVENAGDVPAALGPRLRAIRLARGIGLRELARRLELSPSSISQIETGKIGPSVRTLYALASEFGVKCMVSLEAPMGCGFGVCVGCVVAVKTDGPLGYGSYKRVCIDGSIFPAEQIRWDVNAMTH